MTGLSKNPILASSTSDEITLKELILKLTEWVNYLKTKWLMILLLGTLGGITGLVYAFYKKPIYTAALTFSLEEEKSGAGSLGSALGIFSGANLIELMKSRSLVEKALLSPITINNKQQSLASFYIKFNELDKGWDIKPELRNVKFEPYADRSKFTLQQDSILGKLYEQIAGSDGVLTVSQKDKKVSIITVEVKSTNEFFSKTFTESIANVVSAFYVETKTKKAKYNYDILQKQTDSVRNELNMSISGVARANDNTYNLNPALNRERATSAKRQVDVQANTAILTQLVANLEMSKVALRKETPLIQVIDKPIFPLNMQKASKPLYMLIGGLIASLLYIIFAIMKRIFHQLL